MSEWDGKGLSPMLFSRTATGAVSTWQCWAQGNEVWVHWGQLGGAMQTSQFKCKPKNEGRANATTEHEQAVKEAVAKWVKQKKKKYSESLEAAGQTVRIKPMLALDLNKRKKPVEFPALMQPKLDGVRCLAYRLNGHVVLQSRGGDYYDVEHIRGELEKILSDGIILDGELYLHGTSLQTITSLVRRPQIESTHLYYCVYDITNMEHTLGAWSRRHELLNDFFLKRPGLAFTNIVMTPDNIVSNQAEVDYYQEKHMENGYEGGIIRTWSGLYREDYRSPDLLKVKKWLDSEFFITGWTSGKGKFENAPIFTCLVSTDDPLGKKFEVVPMGTAEERQQMLRDAASYVGQLLKVRFLDFTDDGKPKCARGISIRHPSDM